MKHSIDILLKTRDNEYLICAFKNDSVEAWRLSDFKKVDSLRLKFDSYIRSMCELEDGTLLIALGSGLLKRWDLKMRTALDVPSSRVAYRMIELLPNIIVSTDNDLQVDMWSVATGETLHTLNAHVGRVYGLVKLEEGYFVTGSLDQTIRVWDSDCNNIATYETDCGVCKMAVAKRSLMIEDGLRIEMRTP